MKSQSLLPTKIDGRDIVKTIKQSDPLDLAIWKLMSDGKKRTRAEICEQLRPYGFRREEVESRVLDLFCSSNRRWFDQQGKGAKTTYQLRKNRLERPFSRGGIEFESISNIRDILVIDEEAKRLFEEQDSQNQNQTNEETMSNANKPSAPPMPDDDSVTTAIDHSQLGAHNWFGAAGKGSPEPENLLTGVEPGAAGRVADLADAQGFDSTKLRDVKHQPAEVEQYSELEGLPRSMLLKLVELLKDHSAVKTEWFDKVRDGLVADPTRPMSVISGALESLDITVNESFEILSALGKIETEQAASPDRSQGEAVILSNGTPAVSTPASRTLASALLEKGAAAVWEDIGPDTAARRLQETGLALSDVGSQNFAAPLALQRAEEEGRIGEHIADQIFSDGQGAKFQVVRTYRKDELETTILRIFLQVERVFAIRDLGDLLVGHPTTAIDYRVRKFLAAGLLKRIESGEGSDRRVHYYFNGDGRYTKPGQEVLDRTNGIAKEGAEHINSINVELDKYGEIPVFQTLADSFAKGFDADRFIAALPRGRMDSGMEWFVCLVGIYGEDVGKVEEAMQALVDGEHLNCHQLSEARLAIKNWGREGNKEEVVNTKPNRSHGESELSSGAAALVAENGSMPESIIQTLLTSGDGADLEQLIQNARQSTEAAVMRKLHDALKLVFGESEQVQRYFDNLVNSKDPAVRKNTFVRLLGELDPNVPSLGAIGLTNAATAAYELFGEKDAGMDFALAATGANSDSVPALKSYHEWANLESVPEVDQVSVHFDTKPKIVVRGMILTGEEAREIKDFFEAISSAKKPSILLNAKIEIQGRVYTFEEIEDVGIELMTILG